MFTGLIEAIGEILAVAAGQVRVQTPFADLQAGESVAIAGVCLTVRDPVDGVLQADVHPETLSKTNLGGWRAGTPVNLERALRLGDRLGGHLVLGHVDGVGRVVDSRPEGQGRRLWIKVSPDIRRLCVSKGSLAVDGVSLTIAALSLDRVQIALIPETLERTTLGEVRVGQEVNLETDVLGKYAAELLQPYQGGMSHGVDR